MQSTDLAKSVYFISRIFACTSRRKNAFRRVAVLFYSYAEGQTGLTDSFYAIVRAFSSVHARDLIRKMHRAALKCESLGLRKNLMTSKVNGVTR